MGACGYCHDLLNIAFAEDGDIKVACDVTEQSTLAVQAWMPGVASTTVETHINYCPMCGRMLREE